jgi:hypothetical protein
MGNYAVKLKDAYERLQAKALDAETKRQKESGQAAKRQRTMGDFYTETVPETESDGLVATMPRPNGDVTNDLMYRGLPRPKETAAARAKRLNAMISTLEQKAKSEWFPKGAKQKKWIEGRDGRAYKKHFMHTFTNALMCFETLTQLAAPFESEDAKISVELDVVTSLLRPIAEEKKMVDGFSYLGEFSGEWFWWQETVERLCVNARELFLSGKMRSEKMDALVDLFQRLNDVFWVAYGDGEDIWRGCLNALQAPEKFEFVCQEKHGDFKFRYKRSSYWCMCPEFDVAIHGDPESEGYKQFIADLKAGPEGL